MFHATSIIYIYIYIIITLILFDLGYTMNEKIKVRRGKKKLEKYKAMISEEIARMQNEKERKEEHRRKLFFQLRRINNLLIYQEAIKELKKEEKYKEAYKILCETTVLSPICGRICPHKSQCEGSCVRGIKGESVSIGNLEAFIGDLAIKNNYKIIKKMIFSLG